MTDKLSIYNGALAFLGETELAAVDEARDARYKLDTQWNKDLVKFCLEQAFWGFATRSVMIDADPGINIGFGFRYGFQKPDDYVRTGAVCLDQRFLVPVGYADEGGLWFADSTPIFVKYVSDDPSFGRNFTLWPATFNEFAEATLAMKACNAIIGKTPDDNMKKDYQRIKISAMAKDALNQPTTYPPMGNWTRARAWGGRGNVMIGSLPGGDG